MIKKDLIDLNDVFAKISKFGNTKFKYAILTNMDFIKPQTNVLENLEKSIKSHLERFEKGRDDLITKLGKRKDQTMFIDMEDPEAVENFKEGILELLERYKEDIKLHDTEMEGYQQLLLENIETHITFKMIPIDQFPEDEISFEQLQILKKHNIIEE
jgi:hypothetical protein